MSTKQQKSAIAKRMKKYWKDRPAKTKEAPGETKEASAETKPAKAKTKKAKAETKPAIPPPGPGEITVQHTSGPKNVKAERVADFFAIHPPVFGRQSQATLTHVPTGLSVGLYRTKALARFVAFRLRALGGAEVWDFTDATAMQKQPEAFRTKLREASDPQAAETALRAAPPVPKAPKAATPSGATTPQYSAPWRAGIDWVAAGKKAYETRLRNQAARQAAAAAASGA